VLQEIITLATDIQETSVNAFIAKPACCREFVAKARRLGVYWDENPSWPGRDWFVRLLLAVASLSRVVEWWEAESIFWNFGDDELENEPLTFVMKPTRDLPGEGQRRASASASASRPPQDSTMSSSTQSSYMPMSSPGFGISQAESTPASERPGSSMAMNSTPFDDLRLQAEHAKSVNIVLELSLGGEIIEWVNPAWEEVLGSVAEDACGSPISTWLAPADVSILADASRHLEEDDTQTAQARFRLLQAQSVSDDDELEREPGPTYIEFEGVGMLMRDRDTGLPSHTMWVIKPVKPTELSQDAGTAAGALTAATIGPDGNLQSPLGATAPFPIGQILSTQAILCRICERDVPTWFFEKHNETCNEVHRLEADILAANERLSEMCAEVQRLNVSLDQSDPSSPLLYSGMLLCPVSRNATGGPLLVAVRKITHDLLEQAIDILTVAHEIATPSVSEEAADVPIQYQRLLSPNSEDKLLQISRWIRPDTDDPAISALFRDIDDLVRQKQTVVNRMRNTILYAERVRQEWEDKVDRMLSMAEDGSASPSASGSDGSDDGTKASPVARHVVQQAKLPVTHTSHVTTVAADTSTVDTPDAEQPPQSALSSITTVGASSKPSSPPQPAALVPPLASDKVAHRRKLSSSRTLEAPLSPRLPSFVPSSRTASTSIKDFDIIKPISKGAFGSVYLAKKRATGDYFAIKALKKSDMIAKNQITNVKAERTILMDQASSPHVAKLFFSFQNKDYLYLVMEYLNGGDCAALIKALGGLPEEWTRNYIAEVVLGLEYLHSRGIVHRLVTRLATLAVVLL